MQLHTLRHPPHSPHPYSITDHQTWPGRDTRTAQPHPLKASRAAHKLSPVFLVAAPNRHEYRKLLAESTPQSWHSGYSEPPESPRPVRSPRPAQTGRLVPVPRGVPAAPQAKPPKTQPPRHSKHATPGQVHRRGQRRAPVTSRSTGAPRRTRGPTQLPVRARLAFPVLGTEVMAEGAWVAEPLSAARRGRRRRSRAGREQLRRPSFREQPEEALGGARGCPFVNYISQRG